MRKKQDANDVARVRKDRREQAEAKGVPITRETFAGKFVCVGTAATDDDNMRALRQSTVHSGMVRTDARIRADIFVVRTPSDPGDPLEP